MEMRAFNWLGQSMGAMGGELKAVIAQRELPQDLKERLSQDLTQPALANLCLQKVQMSVAFILKSGSGMSENAGEMLLSEYLRRVLSEAHDCLPSSTAQKEIHLWHVDAFAKLLGQLTHKDPMEKVDLKYQEKLPEDVEDQLKSIRKSIPQSFADCLGRWAEGSLTESYIGADLTVSEILQHIPELEGPDMQDAVKSLPADLLMKHWASLYRALKGEQ